MAYPKDIVLMDSLQGIVFAISGVVLLIVSGSGLDTLTRMLKAKTREMTATYTLRQSDMAKEQYEAE